MTSVREELLAVAAEIGPPFGLALTEEPPVDGPLLLRGGVSGWEVGACIRHSLPREGVAAYRLQMWVGLPDQTIRSPFLVAAPGARTGLVDRLLKRDARVFVPGFDDRPFVSAEEPGYARAILSDPRVQECVVEVHQRGAALRGWPRGGIHAELRCEEGLRGRGRPVLETLLRLAPLLVELEDIPPLGGGEGADGPVAASRAADPLPDVMRAEVAVAIRKRRRRDRRRE